MCTMNLTIKIFIIIQVLLLNIIISLGQKQKPSPQKQKQGIKRKRKPNPLDVEPFSSIEINYPMNIFDITNDNVKDWRLSASFQQSLYDHSENGKPYAYYANAQDQEDIWLYEHMFYGMKGISKIINTY